MEKEMHKKSILFVYSNMGDGGTQRQKSILSKELKNKYNLTMALFKNEHVHKFDGQIIDIKAPTTKNVFLFYTMRREEFMCLEII